MWRLSPKIDASMKLLSHFIPFFNLFWSHHDNSRFVQHMLLTWFTSVSAKVIKINLHLRSELLHREVSSKHTMVEAVQKRESLQNLSYFYFKEPLNSAW